MLLGGASLAIAAGAVWMTMARAAPSGSAQAGSGSGGQVVAPGLVEGTADVLELGFESAGRIVELPVREGERVAHGQLLARLDDRLARARLAQADAALAAARARRDATVRGARLAEIHRAEAEADAARAEAGKQGRSRARTEELYAAEAATPDDLDRSRGAAAVADAQSRAAAAHLALVREGSRSEERREALARVAAAEADRDAAAVLLSQTELRAPIAGVILRRRAEPGEQVVTMPPTVVVTMVNLDRLRLRAEFDEADVARVRVGQRGHATAEAFGARRFAGKVAAIMGELGRKQVRVEDPRARVDTRVLEVLFELDERQGLPLGLRMQLHLPTELRP
jgi:HlyD family secretion protein